jgi:7-cyano-7-deazaguanine synthase
MGTRTASTLILLSGGIDSAACLAFHSGKGKRAHTLFIDYGQPAARYERASARRISKHFGARHKELKLTGLSIPKVGEITGRNLLLLACAFTSAGEEPGLISIGIHAGTTYADCTPGFIEDTQQTLDTCVGGTVRVHAPFLRWSKDEVFQFALEQGVPVEQTYSCERGSRSGCGRCHSCIDRARLM